MEIHIQSKLLLSVFLKGLQKFKFHIYSDSCIADFFSIIWKLFRLYFIYNQVHKIRTSRLCL